MSSVKESVLVHDFAAAFAEELEYLAQRCTTKVSGEMISRIAYDVIRIDLRLTDVAEVISAMPPSLERLLVNARNSPATTWAIAERLAIIKSVAAAS